MDTTELEQMFQDNPNVITSVRGKRYILLSTDENGDEIRLYEDGTKRNQNGHALERIPGGNEIITRETAREYHAMRKAKILQSIESKLTKITDSRFPAEAIAEIVGKRAELAMSDMGKNGNDAARIVLHAVDAYQDKQDTAGNTVTRHEYTIDAETRTLLETLLHERRQYIDATVTQTGEDSDG